MSAAAAAAAVAAAMVGIAGITYAVCGSSVVRAFTAATAARAQVPPAADPEGSSYHRLLRAALCHIGKDVLPLDSVRS